MAELPVTYELEVECARCDTLIEMNDGVVLLEGDTPLCVEHSGHATHAGSVKQYIDATKDDPEWWAQIDDTIELP